MRAGLVADTFLEAMSITHFKKKYEEYAILQLSSSTSTIFIYNLLLVASCLHYSQLSFLISYN